uniref:Uncharacterized protein n=2 Tax=Quercus lobata TaxID=97700 RepID=A0A7N2MKP2_QUELO
MNTKSMRLPPRRLLTPNATTKAKATAIPTATVTVTAAVAATTNNNKRKEREKEGVNATITKIPKPAKATTTARAGGIGSAELVFSSNKILAGYLAHEFLTRGTLFGQQWDPTSSTANQNEAVSVSSKKAEKEKKKPSGEVEGQVEEDQQQRYVELANLLKTGGAHFPGIVNPTQLTHFLHKKM